MPKDAVQRLHKIEEDIKTVISIYEVSNKCKNTQDNFENNELQLPQTTTQEVLESTIPSNRVRKFRTSQFDFLKKTANIFALPSQDVYSTESVDCARNHKVKKPRSVPLSFSKISTVSYLETKKMEDYSCSEKQDQVPNTHVMNNISSKMNLLPHFKKSKERKSGNVIAKRRQFVSSRVSSTETDYSDLLRNVTSNLEGSPKHFHGLEKDNCFSAKTSFETQQKTKKVVEHENEELWVNKISKIVKKNNEKLKKMKVSKELALNIAKHLKEKCDEIRQSKQELMKKLLEVQKDNERMKNELKEFKTKQKRQHIVNNEMVEKNIQALQTRICELEEKHREELLEKQREIDKIQRERFVEIKNELKTRKNQARHIQQLSNENCELLERNDELALLLNDSDLENQFLEQKIRQLQEEIQTQKQHLKIKEKQLKETINELESVRQSSNCLEEQVKILRKNIENFDETHKNFVQRTEEYEQQAKQNLEEIKKLRNENLTLKSELEGEKDTLLIKAKIIEDQQETIKQLKEKSEEAKTLLKKIESLERILNTERGEKLELQEAVECLKWRKEELKKKVRALENDLLLAPQEVARDLEKTQIVLFELENQVYCKQKEWEFQLHSLIKEKEQACSVAEYATKKLIQTSSEFQKQSEAHRTLLRMLAKNWGKKEKMVETNIK